MPVVTRAPVYPLSAESRSSDQVHRPDHFPSLHPQPDACGNVMTNLMTHSSLNALAPRRGAFATGELLAVTDDSQNSWNEKRNCSR